MLTIFRLDRCVTIKIKTAERTKYSQELKILLDLQKSSNGHDRDHVIQLLNHFYIEGPNGCHQALVFELIGPGVDQTIEGAASIPEELDFEEIVEAAVPLLRGLDFVHKAGHAHGGKMQTPFWYLPCRKSGLPLRSMQLSI